MALILDTLSYSEKLAKGCIPQKQAEAHAKAIASIIDEQYKNQIFLILVLINSFLSIL